MMTDEPAKASDNWYEFASQQVDFGINTGLESNKLTIKQIETYVTEAHGKNLSWAKNV